MTKNEMIRMARECGGPKFLQWSDLERFTNLVAEHEREACAVVAQAYEPRCDACPSGVANAIRGRKG